MPIIRPDFAKACAMYPHRFTADHMPAWARDKPAGAAWYYAPQFSSDSEWYAYTTFPGEAGHKGDKDYCMSKPTWPWGQKLCKPFDPDNRHATITLRDTVVQPDYSNKMEISASPEVLRLTEELDRMTAKATAFQKELQLAGGRMHALRIAARDVTRAIGTFSQSLAIENLKSVLNNTL